MGKDTPATLWCVAYARSFVGVCLRGCSPVLVSYNATSHSDLMVCLCLTQHGVPRARCKAFDAPPAEEVDAFVAEWRGKPFWALWTQGKIAQ